MPGLLLWVDLSFRDEVQKVEEFGEAYVGGFGSPDQRFAFGTKSGDAEGHGDAVVAAGVDDGAMELLAARDIESIFKLFHFCAHGAEITHDECDAVRLFYT